MLPIPCSPFLPDFGIETDRMLLRITLIGLCLFFPASLRAVGEETVSCQTSDGVLLKGTLYRPKGSPKEGWVLLHGLGSTRGEWDPLARELVKAQVAVLAMDLRGHGESVMRDDGSSIRYQAFNQIGPASPWNAMIHDVQPAVVLLAQKTHLNLKRIAVGGASLGANVAMNYAADHADVPAVVLLSPGVEYAGVKTEAAFKAYGLRPLFMAASPGDGYAFQTVQYLARMRPDAGLRLVAGEGAAHGVQMFTPGFLKKLSGWMSDDLKPARSK